MDWLTLKDRALDVAAEGITIADARLPDRPLIYANEGFVRMTGYSIDEVLGRNCRFLQGAETDDSARAALRAALSENRDCVVEIRNYRKDGTAFWNRLSISPVRDSAGEVTHFIGIQSDLLDLSDFFGEIQFRSPEGIWRSFTSRQLVSCRPSL